MPRSILRVEAQYLVEILLPKVSASLVDVRLPAGTGFVEAVLEGPDVPDSDECIAVIETVRCHLEPR